MDEESRLIERASRGDALAVEALLQRYLPSLRAFIRLRASPLVRSHESSTDIAQSVCREILHHADRFQHGGEAGFRAWLFTTALRTVQNRHQRWRADKRGGGEAPAGADVDLAVYARISSPSHHAMAKEQAERIERAFDELSEPDREVIALSRVVGLSHREIGEQVGCSEAAARVRLLRALNRLAAALDR